MEKNKSKIVFQGREIIYILFVPCDTMQILNYIWRYDWEIYVSLLSPDFPEETCQRLNISSGPQPSINRKKWKGTPKWKKRVVGPSSIPSYQLLAMSTEPGERKENECQRNARRTKTNRGWEFRLEAYLSNLYLFYSDLAIREAIKNMLSISDKWSKLQTDPAAATNLLFWKLSNTVIEAHEGSHLVATR